MYIKRKKPKGMFRFNYMNYSTDINTYETVWSNLWHVLKLLKGRSYKIMTFEEEYLYIGSRKQSMHVGMHELRIERNVSLLTHAWLTIASRVIAALLNKNRKRLMSIRFSIFWLLFGLFFPWKDNLRNK